MTTPLASQRLQPLQQLAQTREEEAARRLLEQQRQLSERELRLHELTRYLAEYEAMNSAGSARMLINQRAFIERLREAVAMQRRLVEQARAGCDAERGRWLLERREVSTLDQLAECYRRRERQIEERRDQKRLDEFALRSFVAAQAAASGQGHGRH
ncbi:flagellar export protein FliJ [Fontimonas sp. SYSU GA230001]|uniref:flagellar export protein FliJ n=1 Tax=Fontimonas sp. SYSU GA230001 TaxID=3142450 RepID=UPI0032B56615